MPPVTPRDAVSRLLPVVRRLVAPPSSEGSGSSVEIFRALSWAIRDQDVDLAEAVAQGVVAGLACKGAFGASLDVATMAGAALATWKAVKSMKNKAARLDPLQVRILSTLATHRAGLDSQALCEHLNAVAPETAPWTLREVTDGLQSLLKVSLLDGNVVEFVTESHLGTWRSLA